jgi:hypothetical protein
MNKEEFAKLPLGTALGLLYDLVPGLAAIQAPAARERPKYDTKISAGSGQVVYASECDASQLQWYRDLSQRSIDSGGQYAEKDAKLAARLDAWLAWRADDPTSAWVGVRGDDVCTAQAPCSRPQRVPWDHITAPAAAPEPEPGSDDDVPF